LHYEVSWDVTNTGKRSGADVSEVYVGEENPLVPRPARELKGFIRVNLRPGETQSAHVELDSRAFSYFDPTAHRWRVDQGKFGIYVGSSVDDIRLRSTVLLTRAEAVAGSRQP